VVVVLAPVTVPAALVVIGAGAAAGAAGMMMNEALNQEEFCLSCILKAGLIGAVAGAVAAVPFVFAPAALGVAGFAGLGAGSGFLGYGTEVLLGGRDWNWGDAAIAVGLGAVTAGAGRYIAGRGARPAAQAADDAVPPPRGADDVAPPPSPPKTGETAATATGKDVHAQLADERRAAGGFDLVNQPLTDGTGTAIQVPRRVDLKTGLPADGRTQIARPDAVRYDRGLILDDKPLGRPIAKDRQEMIRFIDAYNQSQGTMPRRVAIQRYDPVTGQPVVTELYDPSDFLP
jgi:hypothetical protein